MLNGVGAVSPVPVTSAAQNKSSGTNEVAPEESEDTQTAQGEETVSKPKIDSESFKTLLSAQEEESSGIPGEDLTPEEEQVVNRLKAADAKVRAHEQAHKAAGGGYAGAISLSTVTGPDGRQYAVAGEVQIDASPIAGDPEATIRKMEIVIRAALAPADPSPQDTAVAQAAQQARLQAQAELQKQNAEERKDVTGLQDEENNDTEEQGFTIFA